jgi:glycosyltransferase involved in cell wall biosynthesis
MDYQLSYIISTCNRLPFLKLTLAKLIEQIQENEEIVVVDGHSTDGTQAYLENLLKQGLIQQYLSEKDRNQAHGWNKAMLMAKGKIIKKIIDDDVFDFQSIRKCASFMLTNPTVDVIISNDLSVKLSEPQQIYHNTRLGQYEKWIKKQVQSFTFGDVHMLISKDALSLIGLYNTNYTMIDWEYSLRISYLRANIIYYTGYNALSVFHEQTVSGQKKNKEIAAQSKRAETFYEYAGDTAEITLWSKLKITLGKHILKNKNTVVSQQSIADIRCIYEQFYKEVETINASEKFQFIGPVHFNEAKD